MPTETRKESVNASGYTLVEWLRVANIDVNLANNTEVSAWRDDANPREYLPESYKIKV